MLRQTIIVALAATLGTLLTSRDVQAWGGYHYGYTHVGPGGVQHWGRTGVAGPYGAYSGGHAYGYDRYGGAYRGGYGYGAHYGGAYHYGGYGGGGYYRGYHAGYYRRW